MFFNFAKRLRQPKSLCRSTHKPRGTRLSLEHLEDRLVPSTAGIDPNLVLASTPMHSGVTATPESGPGNSGFTPAQIRQAYGFNNISYWNPYANKVVPGDGTGETIAIVDSYDDPNLASDVDTFDKSYGLSSSSSQMLFQQYGSASSFLSKINQTGGTNLPAANPSWSLETSLDVEWAHAMAPGAKIVLVEANSDSMSDLMSAAKYAAFTLEASVVSMSFGVPTSSWDTDLYDPDMSGGGPAFVAAAGDYGNGNYYGGQTLYPASSAYVLGVGGTNLQTDPSGNYVSESVWSGSDGGSALAKQGPDVGYNATHFAVYDSYGQSGWVAVNGTSAGTPQWAAIVAIADQASGSNFNTDNYPNASQLQNWLQNMPSFDFHGPQSISGVNAVGDTASTVVGMGTPFADRIVAGLANEFTPSGTNLQLQPGQAYSGVVATFSYYTVTPYSTSVSIYWGDGTSTGGQIVSEGNGHYEVLGSHTYNSPGKYTIDVQVDGYGAYGRGYSGNIYSTAAVNYTPDQLYVESLFQHFLGRSGSPSEWSYWVSLLPSQGVPTQAQMQNVAYGISHSTEALDRVVNQMYEAFLGRPADSGGEGYWVYELQHGMTEEQVMVNLLSSAEIWSDYGGNPYSWVNALYQDVLLRPADSGGLNYWVGQLYAGVSRAQIASDIVNGYADGEFRTKAVEALYDNGAANYPNYSFIPNMLHRYADSGMSYWVSSGIDLLSMEVDFASCTEFWRDATGS